MFKIMKDVDKIGEVEFFYYYFFSRVDSVMSRGHSLMIKMRVRTVLRQGSSIRSG